MEELQENSILHHRDTIALTLSPFLDLLKDQKQTMTQTTWLRVVRTLMFRIIETPEQYLPVELARSEESPRMIRSVFHEFILDQTPFPIAKNK